MVQPDKETRADGRRLIAELKKQRDQIHKDADDAKADADAAMWRGIDEVIRSGKAMQVDAVKETGYTRDHVLKKTKQYRDTGEA
ncbi:hypothetical protein F7Q99_36730 [Streptomyces kaniharaensis]|uniref:Uncharacterized protein n=1 Tax=Streptomyces kaniharaensis TaxID=212423 RepID=A0A6N7L428_9ACTN|nr:hypothetical protein [Streptomyces kaniharaensis]MQS17587.1 hypothetical protein [Streptomyces kaniharaensis]